MKDGPKQSLLDEQANIQIAIDLIELGARLPVVESETCVSRPRLLRLYKEVHGRSPSKGLLPFSTDWFVTWKPSIHSSLFYNLYVKIGKYSPELTKTDTLIKAYRLYHQQIKLSHEPPVLTITRAWIMIRFFESNLLEMKPCSTCSGHFITHAHSPHDEVRCGLCHPPSRAGNKVIKNGEQMTE